jgi:hypothetical protein
MTRPSSRSKDTLLEMYRIVLQLVRSPSPYLPALRARSTSLGREGIVRIRLRILHI